MSESNSQRFEELLERFDHAMLVSVAADGSLHARPMAIAAHADVAKLCFVTSSDSAKADELAERPAATAVMQGDDVYLAVSGNAIMVADRERIEALWKPAWKLWFPEGPGDPRLVLIEIEPERAEYWDRTGARRLEFLWQAGKALAKGEAVSDEDVPGHGKVSFE